LAPLRAASSSQLHRITGSQVHVCWPGFCPFDCAQGMQAAALRARTSQLHSFTVSHPEIGVLGQFVYPRGVGGGGVPKFTLNKHIVQGLASEKTVLYRTYAHICAGLMKAASRRVSDQQGGKSAGQRNKQQSSGAVRFAPNSNLFLLSSFARIRMQCRERNRAFGMKGLRHILERSS
jgi:hypothetical protein